MSYLTFDKKQLVNLEYSLFKEILRTNMSGSYSLSTIVGCNTRKYHGALVVPIEQFDNERFVLLSSLDETIIEEGKEFRLGIHKYPGDYYVPKGHKYIIDLYLDSVAGTLFQVGNIKLLKESVMVENKEQLLIKYTLKEAPEKAILRFSPYLAFRNMHNLSKMNMYANTRGEKCDKGIKYKMYDGFPYLHIQISKASEYITAPDWYKNIEYFKEIRRGYEAHEDLLVPGYFEVELKEGESIYVSASTEEENTSSFEKIFKKIASNPIKRDCFKDCLINAANQFFVKKDDKVNVIAGYPWFGSWGRDTFIALPGLTLAIDNDDMCKQVIQTMVKKQKGGLFPNMGDGEQPAFNSIDAPLWFFWALQQYVYKTNKHTTAWKEYKDNLIGVLNAYKNGADFNIKMHENGLIYGGMEGKALTWMDAVYNGRAATARIGYNVEINGLWYNAIMFSLELAKHAKDKEFIKEWESLPELIKTSFNDVFWNKDKGYLADYVNGEYKDWSIRPNMVLAVALPYCLVSDEIKKAVVTTCERDLLTSRGLRTLSPMDMAYKGFYGGNQESRDMAYHQGTVWPWLLEFYCKAYIDVYKKAAVSHIQQIIDNFEPHLFEQGIGTISEVFDGDPPHKSHGTISQAWSVSSLLQIMNMLETLKSTIK